MYMRIVEANIKKGQGAWLERVYEDSILHSLQETPGCVFAGLMYSIDSSNKYLSLTIWKSEKDAGNYVNSGEFTKNIELINPVLEESIEWKIRLSKSDVLEYEPVTVNPVVKSYPISGNKNPMPDEIPVSNNYMRVLSLTLKPEYTDEFNSIYKEQILPELKKVKGCKYAFLIEDIKKSNEILSFTIWDNPESIKEYETQGKFHSFLESIRHTLGELYQWKMSLEENRDSKKSVTSQDADIKTFTLITGKNFT